MIPYMLLLNLSCTLTITVECAWARLLKDEKHGMALGYPSCPNKGQTE